MNTKIELYVNGNISGSTIGQVDLYQDEPISITYSITDIKDISKRNSTYSQSFTVPANKNNNILFNHIFNIGSDSSFDPSKKTPAYLLVDSLMVIQGHLQLTKIKVKNKNVESYDVIIYGEAVDLVKTLGDSYLTDLDFSELNHNRDVETIKNSWTANTANLGYYYPLIDYGYDLDLNELNSGVLSIEVDYGYTSVAASTTLTDTTKIWTINSFATYQVNIVAGTGVGQIRTIASNTGTILTITTPWTTIPDNTSKYTITRLDTTNINNSTGNGLRPSIFKPALSNTYLFKKILNNVGYSNKTGFIESDVFAQTIIPFNGVDDLTKPDYYSYRAYIPQTTTYIQTGVTFSDFDFSNDSTNGGFDYADRYNTTTYKYTTPSNIPASGSVQQFMVDLSYGYNIANLLSGVANTDVWYVRFFRSSLVSGVGSVPNLFCQVQYRVDKCPTAVLNDPITHKYFTVSSAILDNGTSPLPVVPNGIVSTSNAFRYPLQAGETVWVEIMGSNQLICYYILDTQTCFYNKVITNGIQNNYIEYNNYVPKKVKQIDLIKSYITKFNLMVIPDKNNPKNLEFIPKDEYFSNGEVKDWSNKLDVSTPIEEVVISEQQSRQIILTDVIDKDYYNTLYNDSTNKVYGEYIRTIDNEWLDPNSKQTLSTIFSPTPSDAVYNTEDIIIPKIGKLESSGAFGRTDFNIRFLRKNQYLMPTVNTITLLGDTPINQYPYAGHLDHPFESTIDYNFGTIEYAFYNTPNYSNLQSITPNNLSNLYYKKTLDDLTDKNSKLIKCKIRLTPADIAQFNYNDSIYIEGLTDDGGHYFTVNKIIYTPTSDEPSVVELIKSSTRPAYELNTTLEKKNTAVKRNVISLGGAEVNSKNSIGLGETSYIGNFSEGSFVSGTNNFLGNYASNTFIIGSNNVVGDNNTNSFIFGSNNFIGEEVTTTASTTITGVTLLGVSNYSATTSNTVYVPNIQFTSTAGTINGISITSIINSVTGGTISYWDSGSTGSYSVKIKNDTAVDATGNYATAIGLNTLASGIGAFAEGTGSNASGNYSHASGIYTLASGTASYSEGDQTIASGYSSHAECYFTVAGGYGSHAEGNHSTASGSFSHAEGETSIASGYASHSQNQETLASGVNSHAEGYKTTSSAYAGHAEGYQSTSSGSYASHAEGRQTTALASYSHAGGYLSVASGQTSFVHGQQSIAGGNGTIVLGNSITGATDNTVYVPNIVLKPTSSIPTSTADSVGEVGSFTYDNTYFYYKTNSGWLRISGNTF